MRLQMLKDIGHPFARGEPVYDLTFENVQAGERTSHLFRLTNGLVVGTGDLSEQGELLAALLLKSDHHISIINVPGI